MEFEWGTRIMCVIHGRDAGATRSYLRFTIYDLLLGRVIQFSEDGRGTTFTVRIVPRASSSEIVGDHEGALRIRIAAPPVDGAANRELIRLLAKRLKVPQNAVEIISGASSRNKVIRLKGVPATALAPLQLKWTSPPKKN